MVEVGFLSEASLLYLPIVTYIVYALGISATSEGELKVLLEKLRSLNIPIGNDQSCEFGTHTTEYDRSVQCGLDSTPLPNGETSGWLKAQIASELESKGFKKETLKEFLKRTKNI